MATVKINLHNKSIADKIQQARRVLTKLGSPAPAAYASLATALKTATDQLEADSNAYDAQEKTRLAADPAGQYRGTKTTTKTRLRLGGFDSGGAYEFDLRAHGAGELEGPWSNVVKKMAS